MPGKTFVQKDQWVVLGHIFTLRMSVKRLRFLLFFCNGGRYSIPVVKQEDSGLGSPCKCPGLMVGVHMFGAHKTIM